MNKALWKRYCALMLAMGLALTGCAGEMPDALSDVTTAATTVATTEAEETLPGPTTSPVETAAPEERFLLTFVGDCTLGSNPTNTYADYGFIKTVGEDYGYPFRNIIGYFESDEATFANLEGPLTDQGNPVVKKHTFRGATDYVNILTQNSVEFVSIANNHTMDYGQIGYDSTRKTLAEAGVPYVERDGTAVFTTGNGLTIGVYGAVYYLLDEADMIAEIAALKERGCDLVIYAPHWGTEGSYKPTRQQTELAHAAIDAGADIVWGSHPHVLQPVESYEGGIIFYSLGNFSFGGNGYPADYDTALIQQEVIRDESGVHLGAVHIVPCCVSSVAGRNNFQPAVYGEGSEEYARVLSKLDGTYTGAKAF